MLPVLGDIIKTLGIRSRPKPRAPQYFDYLFSIRGNCYTLRGHMAMSGDFSASRAPGRPSKCSTAVLARVSIAMIIHHDQLGEEKVYFSL